MGIRNYTKIFYGTNDEEHFNSLPEEIKQGLENEELLIWSDAGFHGVGVVVDINDVNSKLFEDRQVIIAGFLSALGFNWDTIKFHTCTCLSV